MQRFLLRAWENRQSPLAWALRPVAALYGALLRRHRHRFECQPERSERLPAIVVVVGNVVAGGAGKTPTTIALAQYLQTQGWQVGIISRGYGRATLHPSQAATVWNVQADSVASDVGDEPLLMQRLTGLPVFVAASRLAAGRALLQAHPQTQLLLCDDGLQHLALQRDIEICVMDDRGIGNGYLLPAGPLREPWPRQWLPAIGQSPERCLYLHTANNPIADSMQGNPRSARASRQLADFALTQHGQAVPLRSLFTPADDRPVLALAGIARPERFFAMLQAQGVVVARTLALPDHCAFDQHFAQQYAGYRLLCTEKDAVKLWQYRPDALAVPLRQTLPLAWLQQLDDLLQTVQAHRPWL